MATRKKKLSRKKKVTKKKVTKKKVTKKKAAAPSNAKTRLSKGNPPSNKTSRAIHKKAMAYPEAHTDYPWGEIAVKVKKKAFCFLSVPEGSEFSMTVKLPESAEQALMFPFSKPTGYGLGKSGWVSMRFDKGDDVPVPLLLKWLDESFRAVAPKTLVKKLDA